MSWVQQPLGSRVFRAGSDLLNEPRVMLINGVETKSGVFGCMFKYNVHILILSGMIGNKLTSNKVNNAEFSVHELEADVSSVIGRCSICDV